MKREDWEREQAFIKSKKRAAKRHKRNNRKAKHREQSRYVTPFSRSLT